MNLVLRPGALRLALALVVVAAHARWLESPADGVAVAGFFLLSGYWVTRLWDTHYSFCSAPVTTFYLSRAWRIYPVAAVGTITAFVLFGASWPALIRDLLLLPRIGAGWPIDPPLWSLVIEEQFYAIAPLLFLLLARPRWAFAVIAVSLACWPVYIVWRTGSYLPVWLWLFAVGIVYARKPLPALATKLAPFSLAATIALCLPTTIGIVPIDQSIFRALMLAASLVFAPYVAACLARPSDATDKAVGDLAFPLYVIHLPVMVFAKSYGLSVYPQLIAAGAAAGLLWMIDRASERRRKQFVQSRRLSQRDKDGTSQQFQSQPSAAA